MIPCPPCCACGWLESRLGIQTHHTRGSASHWSYTSACPGVISADCHLLGLKGVSSQSNTSFVVTCVCSTGCPGPRAVSGFSALYWLRCHNASVNHTKLLAHPPSPASVPIPSQLIWDVPLHYPSLVAFHIAAAMRSDASTHTPDLVSKLSVSRERSCTVTT